MRIVTYIPSARPPFPAAYVHATVSCDQTRILPAFRCRISYYFYEELFERIFLIQRDRNFADNRITVTLHDGRQFEWDRARALQCFTRLKPDPRRLLDMLPPIA